METIIQKTGQQLFYLNLRIKRLLCSGILKSHTTVISFILLACLLPLLLTFTVWNVKTINIFLFSSAVVFFLLLTLLFIGSFHEVNRIKKTQLLSYFQFNRSNLNIIPLAQIGCSKSDLENLNLILNNLQPKQKINFRLVSDNRTAADYKKLFRILHLLIEGGIKNFKKEQKEMFFKFIESTFTLNGSEVKRASLNSRFSEFVNESETEFSENLKPFQKFLDR